MAVDQASCFLCKQQHKNNSSPVQWKSEDARKDAFSLNIPQDGVVCQPCRKDITRVLSDGSYTARWLKPQYSKTEKICCINQCQNAVFACLQKSTLECLNEIFQSLGLEISLSTVPLPVPLCTHHYHMVYNTISPTQTNCATCKMSLRHYVAKLCPQP